MDDFPFTVITADGTFKGRLTEEDVLEVAPEYVRLDPNYEQVIKFLGKVVIDGDHEKPALAMYTILDQMRYLTQADPEAAYRVLSYFKDLADKADVRQQEDQHLEAEYEDRYGQPDLD